MCIIHKSGKTSFGTSANFELPEIVTNQLLERKELGHVMDEIMNAGKYQTKRWCNFIFHKWENE